MEADPLFHIKQLFYQGSYKAAILEASSQPIAPFTDDSAPGRAVYVARCHLALNPPAVGDAKAVLAPFLSADPALPSVRAASAFASYIGSSTESERDTVVDEVRDIVLEVEDEDAQGEEGIVRAIAGTVFILHNEQEEAVATLTEGAAKTDLECIAVLVQLLLALDRRDLAQTTYNNAKKIGNDSTLIQAIEAWIGLKTGGRSLHQAYYFYEELYQLPGGRTAPVLASHAAAHLLLNHLDEAKADLSEAKLQEGGAKDPNVLAVGTTIGDGEAEQALTSTSHPFASDLAAKSKAFDEAADKFSIPA